MNVFETSLLWLKVIEMGVLAILAWIHHWGKGNMFNRSWKLLPYLHGEKECQILAKACFCSLWPWTTVDNFTKTTALEKSTDLFCRSVECKQVYLYRINYLLTLKIRSRPLKSDEFFFIPNGTVQHVWSKSIYYKKCASNQFYQHLTL